MRPRGLLIALFVVLLVLLPVPRGPAAQTAGTQRVVVANLPAVQEIRGEVSVENHPPRTRLDARNHTVATAEPAEMKLLTPGGVLDATGFSTAVLSLAGEVKGTQREPARAGVFLLPDEPRILEAFEKYEQMLLPVHLEAEIPVSPGGLFQSEQRAAVLGFPRYRVYYYNTGPRSVEVTLYAYLTNG